MIRRTPSFALLVALVAACSGSDTDTTANTSSPTTELATSAPIIDPPATEPPATDPPATDPVATEPPATDPPATDSPTTDPVDSGPIITDPEAAEPGALLDPSTLDIVSVVDQLNRLPLAAANAALAEDGTVIIESSDVRAAAGILGVAPASDDSGGLDTFREIANPASVDRGGSGLGALSMLTPDLPNELQASDGDPEFGFSILDVDAFASIASFPPQITVMSGDLVPSSELVDLGGGVLSAGDGDDFTIDVENRTPARPLGRPHRVAVSDGLVGISLSTPGIEEWLAGGPTLAAEPTVLAAAEALDRSHVVSSMIQWGDLTVSVDLGPTHPADLLQVPFGAVGIGVTAVDGAPATIVSYTFDDDAAADSAVGEIEEMWRNGSFFMRPLPISEMFEVIGVERVDNTVVVTMLVDDETTTLAAFQMLYAGEPLFAHA